MASIAAACYRPVRRLLRTTLRPLTVADTHKPTDIPYRNILNASVDDLELTVHYALPISVGTWPSSKPGCCPISLHYTFADKNPTAKIWVTRLLDHAYGVSQINKRIKVLVNPFGGQGAAHKLWKREIEPIFKAARCEIDVEFTKHKEHAVEIAEKLDIDRYDVVACCSGDGLPHEVFNGLAKQKYPRRALKKIAVVQLPCGSGNAMSLNLNGTNSPSLAALAIVKGLRTSMDLVAITQGDKRYLSFLSQSVGIVAESDLGTENLRWLGNKRFDVGFVIRLLGKTVYPADVAVKVEIADKQEIRNEYARNRSSAAALAAKGHQDHESELADEPLDEELPVLRYGTVRDELPADWETVSMPTLGNFYAGNMAYMSADAPFFPCALPSDHLIDLVNIDGTIPRWTAFKAADAVTNNTFFDLDIVDYRKVSAYRISPRLRPGQKEGYISIDGERVPFEPFQAEVLRELGTVLSCKRGAYEFDGPREAS